MAGGELGQPHFFVRDRVKGREYSPAGGGGDPKIRDVESRAHGEAMREQLSSTIEEVGRLRGEEALGGEELRALGSIIVLEASNAAFPLKLESLEQMTRGGKKKAPRPKWLLLSVMPGAEEKVPEQATVWVSDEFRQRFIEIFEKYLKEKTKKGNPKNRALIANISRIRTGVTADLWRSAGVPPKSGRHWWELWLRRTDDGLALLGSYASRAARPW